MPRSKNLWSYISTPPIHLNGLLYLGISGGVQCGTDSVRKLLDTLSYTFHPKTMRPVKLVIRQLLQDKPFLPATNKVINILTYSQNLDMRPRGAQSQDGLIDWLSELLTDCLTYWLTVWLTDCQTDWLSVWLTDCQTYWLTYWLTNWLNGLLTVWLTYWLTDWLTVWLTVRLTDWLTVWLTDCQTYWLTYWLTDCQTYWLTYWLTNWLNGLLTDCPTY